MRNQAIKLALASAAKGAGFDPITLPQEHRPGAWLDAQIAANGDLEVQLGAILAQYDLQVWQGGPLPNGAPAPADAQPGAAYWIVTPSGTAIFQWGTSPYVPNTPGLAPGALTPENTPQALQAHARALAEMELQNRLTQEYLEYLTETLL
ncbi:hypothetical protein HRbin14_02194 [bacterium HR14]|nr:hypothetical protein HRbin14_02194 [bacterium HR14]